MEGKTEAAILSEATETVQQCVDGLGVLQLSPEEEAMVMKDCMRIFLQSANIIDSMLRLRDDSKPADAVIH